MDTKTIITTVIGTLFGGGFGAYLSYKLGYRKQDEAEFSVLVREYKGLLDSHKVDLDSLRQEVVMIRAELVDKDREILQLRNQLMVFESSHSDVPVPMWLKDTSGVMLFVNDEFERVILHPMNMTARDYIGYTDSEIWGDVIGKELNLNDKRVMRTKKVTQFQECWRGGNGQTWCGKIIKYPRFLNSKTVIGIGGIIVDRWKVNDNGERIR